MQAQIKDFTSKCLSDFISVFKTSLASDDVAGLNVQDENCQRCPFVYRGRVDDRCVQTA